VRKFNTVFNIVINMIQDRIVKYIDFKGITKYRFYKETGLSNGSLDKNGAIGSDKCEKICLQYPDLNIDWLITGRGDMLKGVETKDRFGKVEEKEPRYSRVDKGIPLMPVSAFASHNDIGVQILNSDIEHYFKFPTLKEKADFIWSIEGESMVPTYKDGTSIICKSITTEEMRYDQPYFVSVNHSPMVKRILPSKDKKCFTFRSDNPTHRDFDVPKDEITAICKILGDFRIL
jgi:repressor LexA